MNAALRKFRAHLITRSWRLAQQLGPVGGLGAVLLILALTVAALAFEQQQRVSNVVIPAPVAMPVDDGSPSWAQPPSEPARLPREHEAPVVIASMQEACRKAGLAWPQAEYRQFDGGKENLSQLEVQTMLKGSYPQVKALVEMLLRQHPALGLRSWSMERPNADTGVADAKLVWVLYLSDEAERTSP